MGDKLGPKNYAKFDRTFMAFGSAMNAMQHIITEKNRAEIIDSTWDWAKDVVSGLVDELYKDNGDNDEKVL